MPPLHHLNPTWILPSLSLCSPPSTSFRSPHHTFYACTNNFPSDSEPKPPPQTPTTPHTPLLDALQSETRRIHANFFCPGHKQGVHALPAFQDALGIAPFSLDLPELPALDNLFSPEGVIEESQSLAARIFTREGSELWDTYFLINGTTCGVHAAVLACVKPGRRVILPRNVHQSAVHALILSGALPIWVQPIYDEHFDLLHGINVQQVSDALDQWKGEVDAILVVSPTYHGVCSDIEALAEVAHAHGVVLIVDEAHGSHFAFHHLLPASATFCTADIVVQSTHKTLPALSQAAMMHVRRERVSKEKVVAALRMVQSTSPNYLLLASLEAARAVMEERGEDLMSRTIDLARNCAVRIASLEGFQVLGVESVGAEGECRARRERLMYALDPTRVTVFLPEGVTGYDLDTHLIDRFGVYCELPSFKHVTFVITPGNTQADVDRLVTSLALYEATSHQGMLDMEIPKNQSPSRGSVFGEQTDVSPRAAFFADAVTVLADDAVGRICVETLCPYPPGIPIVVPGERITADCVEVLQAVLEAGGSVSGASDESLSTLRVAVCEESL